MLNNLRTRLPDLEEAREAAVNRAMKAAEIAAQAAKDASEHFEEWAKDGLNSVRSRPLMWSAASLGFGVLIGGLFALWSRAKSNGLVARRTMPARSRSRKILRELTKANGAAVPNPKRRTQKTRRAPESTDV